MIRRLQHKFVLVAMISLLLIVVVLIGGVNAYNAYKMNETADDILALLAKNDGKFPAPDKPGGGSPPRGRPGPRFEITAETEFETRYFTVKTYFDGSDTEVNTRHIAAVSEEQAGQYAGEVLSGGRATGYESVYKYLAVETSYGMLVIFLDRHLQLQTLLTYFWGSCGMAFLCLAVMFVLVSVLSKRAISPVVESIEKQKRFIADAGHEIKTPLAIISANTEVIELDHGKSECTERIRRQTGRLDELVRHLLALSKMEEMNERLTFADFSISEMVSEEAVSFNSLAERQGKSLEWNIQRDLNYYGDENAIRQVVSILLDNAVKYSGVETIKVELRGKGRSVYIDVRNTVEVLPEGDLNRLFDRFYRADESRSRESGGYGLGLSIAKAIVQAHKGKISVRCEKNLWICFTVTLYA